MTELSQLTPMRSIASMSSMSFTNTHDDSSTQSLELITINDLYDTEDNLGHIKEIHELKGRTMLFKISAKKEHYVRRNIPFPVVKIKTDQLLLQQLCPDLLALDENDFNSDNPISEGDDKFLEYSRSKGSTCKAETLSKVGPLL
nr:replication factor A protein 1-like [Ipomoea batatas]